MLERSYSRTKLLKFQEDYSVPFIGGSSPDERGLMVIKTSKKTKARQRKGAIANWKVIIETTSILIAIVTCIKHKCINQANLVLVILQTYSLCAVRENIILPVTLNLFRILT